VSALDSGRNRTVADAPMRRCADAPIGGRLVPSGSAPAPLPGDGEAV